MIMSEGVKNVSSNDSIGDAVVEINDNFDVVAVNRRALQLFGPPDGKKCYKYLYGFDKPCSDEVNYVCPITEGKKSNISCLRYVTVQGNLQRAFVRMYPLNFSNGASELFGKNPSGVVELIIPYKELLKVISGTVSEEKVSFFKPKPVFEEKLQSLIEKGKIFYLIAVNIRKLKHINEIYGVPAGDLVISGVESKIVKLGKEGYDFIYTQLAGGFFLLFMDKSLETILSFEKTLIGNFRNLKITYLDKHIYPKVTVTTIEIDPRLIKNLKDLYKLIFFAEKNREEEEVFHLFNGKRTDILDALNRKEELTKKLQTFLVEDKVTYHLQPIVFLETGQVSHYEVLMRFIENGGYTSAGKYMELIYELGLIIDFDLKLLDVLDRDLDILKKLKKPIFINVSGEDLKLLTYRNRLKRFLKKATERGVTIYLELTEHTVFNEWGFLEFLAKKYALEFAIDDFGTGYSSLKVVTDLAAKKISKLIKLDMSLVRDYLKNPYTKALVDTIAEFSKRFDIEMVAEGIETEELYKALKEAGLKYGQGYYFSKPLPLEEAIKKYAPSTG